MAIMAIIENGKLVSTGTTSTISDEINSDEKSNAVDEDMFLQLLVAEMKYQDPLEPTSNTEWVSQYATFTQVEQMTAMQQSIQQSQGSDLVGKHVIMKTTDSKGETSYHNGIVDYMYVENGKTYLSVDGNLYSMDELDTVVNADYMTAVEVKASFEAMMAKLPTDKLLTLSDSKLVSEVRETYDKMTDYQKQFISAEHVTTLTTLEKKLKELKENAGITEVEDLINALPEEDALTVENEEALIEAREKYEALTTYNKQYVSEDCLKKLTTLEEKLEALKGEEVTEDTGEETE